MTSTRRHLRDLKTSGSARRRVVKLLAAVAILGGAVSVGTGRDAGANPTASVQASIALSLSTPTSVVGPFIATDATPLVNAATGTLVLAGSDLAFAPADIEAPPQWQFSASLMPDSDVSALVNPTTGEAVISGQFTMQLQDANDDVSCQIGPFSVNATTQPSGAVGYSPISGEATVIDGNPTIPAVSNCGSAGDAINGALWLPMPEPPAQASSAAAMAGSSDPPSGPVLPAISLQLAISPPLQAAPAPTTVGTPPTTARPGTPTDPPASHDPPASQGSKSGSTASGTVKQAGVRVVRSKTPRTKAAPVTSQNNTPATLGPAGFGAIPADPVTPGAEPANLPKGDAFASAPVSAAGSSGSLSRLPFVLLLGTAGLAIALWLIGSNLRKGLVPARERHQQAFRGTVLRPSRTKGAASRSPR